MDTKNKTSLLDLKVTPLFNLPDKQTGTLDLTLLSNLSVAIGAKLSFTADSSQHYSVKSTDSGISSVNVSGGSRPDTNTVTLTLSKSLLALIATELLVSVTLDSPNSNPTSPSEFNLTLPVLSIGLSGACEDIAGACVGDVM